MKVFHAVKQYSPAAITLTVAGNIIRLATYIQSEEDSDSFIGDMKLSCDINFEEIVASPQAESGAAFNVYFGTGRQDGSGNGVMTRPVIVNSNAVSGVIRGDASSVYRIMGGDPPAIVICLPYKGCAIDDAIIGINTTSPASESVKSNMSVIELEPSKDLEDVRKMVRPKFLMSGASEMAQGGTEAFTINVVKDDGTVDAAFNDQIYFESTGGILAVSKVQAVNGVAQARLIGDHLIAGDVVTVKAGTKFFTSLAKIDVRVVA